MFYRVGGICKPSLAEGQLVQSNDKHELNKEINLSTYNYETADWKSIKLRLKNINWSEMLENYKTSEEKMNKILEVVIKIIEENCLKYKYRRGALINKIPRDRRILLRKRKKIRAQLERKVVSSSRKSVIKKSMGEIDNRLLLSHENEKNDMEKRAIENIKSNPKHFFAYARENLKLEVESDLLVLKEKYSILWTIYVRNCQNNFPQLFPLRTLIIE